MQNLIDISMILILLAAAFFSLRAMKKMHLELYEVYRVYVGFVIFIEIIFAFLYKYPLK